MAKAMADKGSRFGVMVNSYVEVKKVDINLLPLSEMSLNYGGLWPRQMFCPLTFCPLRLLVSIPSNLLVGSLETDYIIPVFIADVWRGPISCSYRHKVDFEWSIVKHSKSVEIGARINDAIEEATIVVSQVEQNLANLIAGKYEECILDPNNEERWFELRALQAKRKVPDEFGAQGLIIGAAPSIHVRGLPPKCPCCKERMFSIASLDHGFFMDTSIVRHDLMVLIVYWCIQCRVVTIDYRRL